MPPNELSGPAKLAVAQAVEKYLGDHALSQRALGEKLGLTQQWVSAALNGHASISFAVAFASLLGVTLDQLKRGVTKPMPPEGAIRLGSLSEYDNALRACRDDAEFWNQVPAWCWQETADIMVRRAPEQLTRFVLLHYARAHYESRKPEHRQEMDTRAAAEQAKHVPRVHPDEIARTFAPTPTSQNRIPLRRRRK